MKVAFCTLVSILFMINSRASAAKSIDTLSASDVKMILRQWEPEKDRVEHGEVTLPAGISLSGKGSVQVVAGDIEARDSYIKEMLDQKPSYASENRGMGSFKRACKREKNPPQLVVDVAVAKLYQPLFAAPVHDAFELMQNCDRPLVAKFAAKIKILRFKLAGPEYVQKLDVTKASRGFELSFDKGTGTFTVGTFLGVGQGNGIDGNATIENFETWLKSQPI